MFGYREGRDLCDVRGGKKVCGWIKKGRGKEVRWCEGMWLD